MNVFALRRLHLTAATTLALSVVACGASPSESTAEGSQPAAISPRPPLGGHVMEDTVGGKPATVGGGGPEYVLVAPGGDAIYWTNGGFSNVSAPGESDSNANSGNGSYSVQLNTNVFEAACNPSQPFSAVGNQCQGWEQFVYQAYGPGNVASVFIEYWILGVPRGCPTGWSAFQNETEVDCFQDSTHYGAPYVSPANLGSLTLEGSVTASGDEVSVSTGSGSPATSTGSDYFGLASSKLWTKSEFNVFGYGGGSEANFSAFSSMTVGMTAAYGSAINDYSTTAPTCGSGSTTGETNNMVLGTCTPAAGTIGTEYPGRTWIVKYPSLSFTESVPVLFQGPIVGTK